MHLRVIIIVFDSQRLVLILSVVVVVELHGGTLPPPPPLPVGSPLKIIITDSIGNLSPLKTACLGSNEVKLVLLHDADINKTLVDVSSCLDRVTEVVIGEELVTWWLGKMKNLRSVVVVGKSGKGGDRRRHNQSADYIDVTPPGKLTLDKLVLRGLRRGSAGFSVLDMFNARDLVMEGCDVDMNQVERWEGC